MRLGRFTFTGALRLLVTALANAAALGALLSFVVPAGAEWVQGISATALALTLAGIAILAVRAGGSLAGVDFARTVAVVGALALVSTRDELLAVALTFFAFAWEAVARRTIAGSRPLASGLDRCEVPQPSGRPATVAGWVGLGALSACVLGMHWPTALAIAISLSVASLLLAWGQLAMTVRSRRARARARLELRDAVLRFGPEFAVHWDAPAGTSYQLTMWLEHLAAAGRPFLIVLRNGESFDDAVAAASAVHAPVVLLERHDELDEIDVPSLNAVFYVNNAPSNTNCTRFAHLWHVQLNHGDSDKPPSFAPSMRQYDRNLVAGSAAIRRFADHGVETTSEYFRIVGRPQLAGVRRSADADDRPRTVLYAPTWAGFNADTAVSSLGFGSRIVEALLGEGATVLFRPHPHSARVPATARAVAEIDRILATDRARTGRPHLSSDRAAALSIVDCFNAVDAMIADVSSVVTDFLASGKPYAITSTMPSGADLGERVPIAVGGLVIEAGATLGDGVRALLGPDERRGIRDELRRDHLGPDPAEAAAVFVAAVLSFAAHPKPDREMG